MAPNDRMTKFKNRGRDIESGRNRRKEDVVELRKAKKDEQLLKRRNIQLNGAGNDSDLDEADNNNPIAPQAGQATLVKDIEKVVQGLYSQDPEIVMQSTVMARKQLSRERNPPIDKFIELKAVPRLVQLLNCNDNPQLQFEASWALTNIASGTSEQTECIVNSGACPHFIRLLSSPAQNVAEQSVWALANIAGDGPEYRDMLITNGIIPAVTQLVTPDTPNSFLDNIAWCLSNLCRNKNPAPSIEAVRACLPSIKQLMNAPSNSALSDACWALSYISDGSDDRIQEVINLGVIERLVDIVSSSNSRDLVTPALRTLGNIVTGNDVQTQTVIDHNALQAFRSLLQNDTLNLRKEVAWAISNVAAGNTNQIQAVINAGLVPFLIEILRGSEVKTQKEATWAISNMTCGGTEEQISHLVAEGCLAPLVKMLQQEDTKITQVVLDAMKNILAAADRMNHREQLCELLEEIGFVDMLEKLQTHDNEDIYNMAVKLIEDYWSGGDEDTGVQVTSTTDQFVFDSNTNPPGAGGFQF